MAKVIPVHRSGNKNEPYNFRPISLTCMACKILEHILAKHITTFLERILSPFHRAFRNEVSIVTQILELIHDLSLRISNKLT